MSPARTGRASWSVSVAWGIASYLRFALGLAEDPISGVAIEGLTFVVLYGSCVVAVWRWIGINRMFGLEAERG